MDQEIRRGQIAVLNPLNDDSTRALYLAQCDAVRRSGLLMALMCFPLAVGAFYLAFTLAVWWVVRMAIGAAGVMLLFWASLDWLRLLEVGELWN